MNRLDRALRAALLLLPLVAVACSDGSPPSRSVIVFNGEDNNLWAYAPYADDRSQVVIPSRANDPNGLDINAQICFDPDGSRRFIAGEDTGQPNPPQGWGFFQLNGTEVGALSATRVGKLTPTYQGSLDNAENYGCGFLSDGRVVTTDVGNQASGGGDGQLIIWFPPFDSFEVSYCKIDVTIGTAGQIYVDPDDNIFVASARVTPGIYLYRPPFPTSSTASGGCGKVDVTGAPLATSIDKSLFIKADGNIPTPNALIPSLHGTYYISSVINGVIAEYDRSGSYVGRILEPPAGETLGPEPYSTGSPFGLGIDSSGTVYYADIGVVVRDGSVGPGPRTGTLRKIPFVDGQPQPPITMNTNLDFPDGIGILEE
jgi:hypothetical protein